MEINLSFSLIDKMLVVIFAPSLLGAIAQLVEQRTENPCVPGSNPGSTTPKTSLLCRGGFLFIGTFFLSQIVSI